MSKINQASSFGERMLRGIGDLQKKESIKKAAEPQVDKSVNFADFLKDGIKETNQVQKMAETKTKDLATGKDVNLHETMLATSYAELSFKLMVQMRNKALEAYQEVMRMPV